MVEDKLDGFRGNPQRVEQSEVEEQHEWLQSLRNSDLDTELLRAILVADELEKELNDESSTVRRLVNMAVERIDAASREWWGSADPTDKRVQLAHRDARAARLILDWVQEVMNNAAAAEKQLEET